MADATYDIGDLVDKSIFTSGTIPVYTSANDHATPAYSVAPGQLIGVLYSWLDPSASEDRSELWFMFWPDNQNPYYTKYGAGYNLPSLVAQGVQTTQQKADAAALAAKPWYEQLIIQYGPYILGTIVISAAVKGLLSRRSNS